MQHLHPVFPVVKLTPAPSEPFEGRKQQPPPPPVVMDNHEEYEVAEILDSRYHYNKLQYLVRFKGYNDSENQWIDAANVHAERAVRAYHRAYPERVRNIVRSDRPWRVRFEDALEHGETPIFIQRCRPFLPQARRKLFPFKTANEDVES